MASGPPSLPAVERLSGLDLRPFRVVARLIRDRSELGLNRLESSPRDHISGRFWLFQRRFERTLCSRRRSGVTPDNRRFQFAGISTGATGLEPATSGVTGRRSNQLNYAPRRRKRSVAATRSRSGRAGGAA